LSTRQLEALVPGTASLIRDVAKELAADALSPVSSRAGERRSVVYFVPVVSSASGGVRDTPPDSTHSDDALGAVRPHALPTPSDARRTHAPEDGTHGRD